MLDFKVGGSLGIWPKCKGLLGNFWIVFTTFCVSDSFTKWTTNNKEAFSLTLYTCHRPSYFFFLRKKVKVSEEVARIHRVTRIHGRHAKRKRPFSSTSYSAFIRNCGQTTRSISRMHGWRQHLLLLYSSPWVFCLFHLFLGRRWLFIVSALVVHFPTSIYALNSNKKKIYIIHFRYLNIFPFVLFDDFNAIGQTFTSNRFSFSLNQSQIKDKRYYKKESV